MVTCIPPHRKAWTGWQSERVALLLHSILILARNPFNIAGMGRSVRSRNSYRVLFCWPLIAIKAIKCVEIRDRTLAPDMLRKACTE
jgi:hypothetical protein